ncbi:MAG: glycoside-pentoside-hexuronide (GPH):cation symporter [Oscillospiraceae bacterium]|nr:glycoside-pentoside-hexuronide (GPH):cation symporter [Oscillospiraceae bacterium]
MRTVITSTKEKLCYAFGNMGGYVLWSFVATFITIYATDCLQLSEAPLAALGTIILLCRFFDGISDIFMGVLIERTHSRLGKARPWFGVSILPLCLTFFLLFFVRGMSDRAALLYISALYFLFAVILYTMNNLGFHAMLPRISSDPIDQTKISTFNSVFTFAGSLVTAIAIPILNGIGGIDKQSAWTGLVAVLALFAMTAEAVCFFTIREKDEIAPVSRDRMPKGTIRRGLKALLSAKYFYIAALMFLINYYLSLSVTASGKYYAEFVLGNVNIFSIFGSVPGLTMVVGLLFTPFLVKRIGKRRTMMCAVSCVALGNIIGSIFPYSFAAGFAGVMIKGLGSATVMCQLFTLAPDIVSYIQLKDGLRIEGLAASANSFGCKIGSGLGTAVVLWALAFSGYVTGAASQPESATIAFIALYWWVPALLSLVLLFLASRWDIDRKIAEMESRALGN